MKQIKKQTDGKWTQTDGKIDKITDKKNRKMQGQNYKKTMKLKEQRINRRKNKQLNTELIQQTSFKLPYSLRRKSAPLVKVNSTYMKHKV